MDRKVQPCASSASEYKCFVHNHSLVVTETFINLLLRTKKNKEVMELYASTPSQLRGTIRIAREITLKPSTFLP